MVLALKKGGFKTPFFCILFHLEINPESLLRVIFAAKPQRHEVNFVNTMFAKNRAILVYGTD